MDGAVRQKPRPGMSGQDVRECGAIPVRLKFVILYIINTDHLKAVGV
jgi:hypothetical protein